MTSLKRILAASAILVVAGCGGDGTGPPPPPPAVRSVLVSPASASILVGATQPLTTTVDAPAGASTAVTWVSESPAIAAVSAQGVVTGVAPGSAIVRATSVGTPSVSGTARIEVTALRSVTITPAATSILTTEQRTLTANVQIEAGANRAVTWRSSAPTIVSVNGAGVVTGVAAGSATITALLVADTTVRGTATVSVAAQVRTVTVAPAIVPLFINGGQILTATVSADAGLPTTVIWRSSNPAIATVSATGLVTALALGQATVTALSTADTTKRGSATITITPRPLAVAIVQRNVGLNPGTSTQLTANVAADPGISTAVNWTTSAASVATISATGVVSAIGIGSALITATSQTDATRRDTVTVFVVPRLATTWTSSRVSGVLFEDIVSIAAFGAGSAYAVNSVGDIYRWNGTTWSVSTRGATFTTEFAAVHGTADGNVIAVGTNGVIARWNGTTWTAMASGTTRTLNAVFAESATSAFAVGVNGTVLRLTAGAWTPVPGGTTASLNGVWSSGGTAWFVGNDAVVLRYDGTGVTRVTVPVTETLLGIAGSSPTSLVAVGTVGTVIRFDGTAWTIVNSNGANGTLYGAVAGPSGRTYIVGDNGLFSLEGSTVTPVSTPYTPRMFSVAVDGTGTVWAGGQRGAVMRGVPGPSSTAFETLNLAPDLLDVWTTAGNNAWAVGEFGFIYRWNGTSWTRQPTPTTFALVSVWAPSATDAFAGGENGTMLRWNGSTWTSMTFPTSGDVFAIWGSSSSNVFATTSLGEVLRFNGTAWSLSTTSVNPLWAVFGTSASDVYVTGEGGTALRFNGTTWTTLPSAAPSTLMGVWMSGNDNVLAVGSNGDGTLGASFRYNGSVWQPFSVGTSRYLTSIWGPSLTDLYVTGELGTLLRFNGTAWQLQPTGTTEMLLSVSGAPNGVGGAFAVGYNATIVSGSLGSASVSAMSAGSPRGTLEPTAAARAGRHAGRPRAEVVARRLPKGQRRP